MNPRDIKNPSVTVNDYSLNRVFKTLFTRIGIGHETTL